MKVVIAPNAFKGSLSAFAAAAAMAAGLKPLGERIQTVLAPVADGGDGLAEVLAEALGGRQRHAIVTGPRGEKVSASFLHVPELGVAVVEMAAASGLALLPDSRRDPTQTSTIGTGELVASALALNLSRLIIGLGGSATCDGGAGMATALGVRFLDATGQRLHPLGANLIRIRGIDMSGLDPRLRGVRVEAICDVDNPLLGENGAARVYGPQKGAAPAQVEELEQGLANLADVIEDELGVDVRELRGAGAAGGMGAGTHAFLAAALRPGVDVVIDLIGLEEKLEGADLVLTGEGCLDSQTARGKAPAGVAALARKKGVPCIAIAGSVAADSAGLHDAGIAAAFPLCAGPMSLEEAMTNAPELLSAATGQAVRAFLAGRVSD